VKLRLYSLLWWLLLPAAALYLLTRSIKQPEYRQGWLQRLALGAIPNAEKGLWIHAVSVGETRAAQPLIAALRRTHPQLRIVLTHMTPTGMATSQALFGNEVQRCYLPYDMLSVQRRFLRRLNPGVGLIMETELWPAMLAEAQSAKVPVALVNARLSDRSLKRGLKRKVLLRPALESLRLVLAQSSDDALRVSALGQVPTQVVGNMKFDYRPERTLQALGQSWRRCKKPRVLVASSRDGEEALLLEAIAKHPQGDSVQWWWVPRHPQRFDEVYALLGHRLASHGVRRTSASFAEQLDAAAWVLGDSMGEMSAYYEASDVVIMGGSLLPFGSQSLIEPCAHGRPVVLGPSVFNFAQAAQAALQTDAAVQCEDGSQAVSQALELALDQARAMQMGQAGQSMIACHQGATQRTLQALQDAGLI
jgi:3-deoxy-D-manno-octulosonic-acid transferase